jgi:hypothetical protein
MPPRLASNRGPRQPRHDPQRGVVPSDPQRGTIPSEAWSQARSPARRGAALARRLCHAGGSSAWWGRRGAASPPGRAAQPGRTADAGGTALPSCVVQKRRAGRTDQTLGGPCPPPGAGTPPPLQPGPASGEGGGGGGFWIDSGSERRSDRLQLMGMSGARWRASAGGRAGTFAARSRPRSV